MSVSTDTAGSPHAAKSAEGSEFVRDDLIETEAADEAEDYQLRAARRAQLEDADTLRRMRAL